MNVVDASVVVDAIVGKPEARAALRDDDLFAPPHIDLEVVQVLRRFVQSGRMAEVQAFRALEALRALGITRYPVHGLVGRVWELRDNLSAYDAAYVAVAEALECGLLTADGRLARAPGARCTVTLLPSG